MNRSGTTTRPARWQERDAALADHFGVFGFAVRFNMPWRFWQRGGI